jgi:2-aminoethylphosphonate-pyruvate transaminase
MIKTAVILAAGMGTRLKEKTQNRPKGFLIFDGKPLIEHSVTKLLAAGIEKIIIGTGHLAEIYNAFAAQYPQVECIINPHYENTGSMFTLYNLKELITDNFLLLESDLLYDKRGLQFLIDDPHPDVILASGLTHSNDEVYIEIDMKNYLVNMSKHKKELKNHHAELVGITKLSYTTFQQLCQFAAAEFKSNPKLDYEYALVGIAQQKKIQVKKIDDYVWCEIDDAGHLTRALNIIYPQIKERESSGIH